MKTRFAISAAIAAALASAPAFAAGENAGIKFSDLDLTSERGQQQLERRIDSAARELCGLTSGQSGTRIPSRDGQACFKRAKESAQQQVARAIARDSQRGG